MWTVISLAAVMFTGLALSSVVRLVVWRVERKERLERQSRVSREANRNGAAPVAH